MTKPKFLQPDERIGASKRAAEEISQMSVNMHGLLCDLSTHLSRLECVAPKDHKFERLKARIDRLRELLNMMETGSFMIEVKQQMELVHREIYG